MEDGTERAEETKEGGSKERRELGAQPKVCLLQWYLLAKSEDEGRKGERNLGESGVKLSREGATKGRWMG